MVNKNLSLDGPRFGPASGGKTSQLIVLLHGVGADGQDLIGLAPHLAQSLPDAAFVSPNAPFPCYTAPGGYIQTHHGALTKTDQSQLGRR